MFELVLQNQSTGRISRYGDDLYEDVTEARTDRNELNKERRAQYGRTPRQLWKVRKFKETA